MRLEDEPLLGRQFFNGRLQFINQHLPRVGRVRPPVVGWQDLLEQEWPALIGAHRIAGRHGRTPLAKPFDDAVSRDAEEPGAHLLDRLQHPRRFHQLREHLLKDVLGVGDIGDAPADESRESSRLPRHHLRDVPILLDCCDVADQMWLLLR